MTRPVTLISVALATAAVTVLAPQIVGSPGPAASAPAISSISVPGSGSATSNPPVPGSSDTGSKIQVVKPSAQPFRLDRSWRDNEVETKILLRNDTQCDLTVTLEMMKVQDRLGTELDATIKSETSFSIAKDKEKILALKVSHDPKTNRLPATGFIKITSTPKPPECKPLSAAAPSSTAGPVSAHTFYEIVIPEGPCPGLAGYVFAASLAVAGLLVLAAIFHRDVRKAGTVSAVAEGDPTWDFQKSWGVNLAIAGGLLGVLLTWTFPEHPRLMTKVSSTTLQSLFTGLTLLAPLIYGLSSGIRGKATVRVVLLSAGLVLWGAFGQAVMLALLIIDFVLGAVLDPLIGGILLALAGLFSLLLVVYGWETLFQTASAGPPPSKTAGLASQGAAQGAQSTPAPKWSLP